MLGREELERLFERLDRLERVLVEVLPDLADLGQDLEALFVVDDVVEDLPLERDDLLPVLQVRVHPDEGLERRPVRGVDAECLLEVVDRLLRLPLLALDAAELVVDVRARFSLALVERR